MRVLLADVEGAARRALASLLEGMPGVTIAGQAGAWNDLAAALRRTQPDVLVIDDRLLREAGHVLAGVGPLRARVRVIVVGVDDDPAYATRARRLGAEAWIAKDRADEELPALLAAS